MEVVLGTLFVGALVTAMILAGAPTWGWLAVLGACLVGNVLGFLATR